MAKVFAESLRRVGRNLSREGLVSVLDRFGVWDVGGMNIRYDETSRTGSSYVDLAVVNELGDLVF
jgi:branched-chain amino acid transport system substrate-binding protein